MHRWDTNKKNHIYLTYRKFLEHVAVTYDSSSNLADLFAAIFVSIVHNARADGVCFVRATCKQNKIYLQNPFVSTSLFVQLAGKHLMSRRDHDLKEKITKISSFVSHNNNNEKMMMTSTCLWVNFLCILIGFENRKSLSWVDLL